MSDLFIAAGCVGGFAMTLVVINVVLCALGRRFPRLGAMMGE